MTEALRWPSGTVLERPEPERQPGPAALYELAELAPLRSPERAELLRQAAAASRQRDHQRRLDDELRRKRAVEGPAKRTARAPRRKKPAADAL